MKLQSIFQISVKNRILIRRPRDYAHLQQLRQQSNTIEVMTELSKSEYQDIPAAD